MPHRPEDELFEGHSTVNFGIDGGEPGFLVPDRRPCRVHAQLDRQPIILVHGHQKRVSIAIERVLTQRNSDLFSPGRRPPARARRFAYSGFPVGARRSSDFLLAVPA